MKQAETPADLPKLLQADPNLLEELFDEVRLVETESACLCTVQNGQVVPGPRRCYAQWRRSGPCPNCVARKACEAGRRMVKLEYVDENYYFVIAQPLEVAGKAYALELVTNITTRMATDGGAARQDSFVQDLSRQLEAVSEHEAFTGLYSKAYLERRLQAQLARAGGEPLYLCVFDIDGFHSINAFYGHVQGDAVLLKFAELLRQALAGRAGYAARFDGDEFALVLENADEQMCVELMRQVQQAFASHLFCVAEMKFHATASAGLANVSGAAGFAQALQMARAARKQTATGGKNGG